LSKSCEKEYSVIADQVILKFKPEEAGKGGGQTLKTQQIESNLRNKLFSRLLDCFCVHKEILTNVCISPSNA